VLELRPDRPANGEAVAPLDTVAIACYCTGRIMPRQTPPGKETAPMGTIVRHPAFAAHARRTEEDLLAAERCRQEHYVAALEAMETLADYLSTTEPGAVALLADLIESTGRVRDAYVGRLQKGCL
jgi:hypothetical protein